MLTRSRTFHMLLLTTLSLAALMCISAVGSQAETDRSEHEGLIYRNPRVYNVDYSFELRPRSDKIDRAKDLKLWIPMPREWESQKAVKIISVQPEPHAKYADPEFGNLMYFWDFGGEPEQPSYKVEIKYRLESYEIYTDIDPNKIGVYDKTSDDYALYTRSTRTISITPKIREMAQLAVGDEKNPYLQATLIYDFVQRKMRFRGGRGVGIQTLLDTCVKDEKTGEECYQGECGQYSAFFVALCRAAGIPTRSVSAFIGWRTWPWIEDKDAVPSAPYDMTYRALGRHHWAEILLPDYGWMPVDPTHNSFGYADNKNIITSKNRDIKIGPYAPQSDEEGYYTGPDGRANMLWNAVWNRAKSSSSDWRILHHSDPFPADVLAEYMTMLYAKVEAEKNLGLYRKRALRWIDENTREHTDKVAALAQAYEKKPRVRCEHEAFICHMLRKIVGDKKFSDIVETYTDLRVKSGEPVSTARFQKIVEDIYGQPIDWFFKQWVGYTELPQLQLDAVKISKGQDGWYVRGTLRQLNKSLYRLPVELALETEKATEHKMLWVEERNTHFDFRATNRPKRVLVDPNNGILKIMDMTPLLEDPLYDEVASFAVPYQRAREKARWTPLHFAVAAGRADIAAFLISKGDDVNTKTLRGYTPLHVAASKGSKEVAELLIARGADVNAKDNEGKTPLSSAAEKGNKEITEFLIARGADMSLHLAARLGDVARVKKLIQDGADVNKEDERGQTPLHAAVAESHKEVAELLITKGADIDAKRRGYPPLYWAVWDEDRDMIKLLVTKGANVNFVAEDDWPYLHYLVLNNDRELVELLLAHGARLNVKNEKGMTEFRLAVSEGHQDLAKFLVSQGATGPEFHLASCLGDLNRVKVILEEGTDVDVKDELGWTPLYWAASTAQEEIAEYLIGKRARVDVRANDNRTPLHQAARSGAAKLAKLLISKGADTKVRNEDDSTPLHSAAERGHKNIVELLITAGAKVAAKEKSGDTPLHKAARAGHADVVDLLLAHGADVNVKGRRGRTALQWAEQRGHTEVVELLRKHGAKE